MQGRVPECSGVGRSQDDIGDGRDETGVGHDAVVHQEKQDGIQQDHQTGQQAGHEGPFRLHVGSQPAAGTPGCQQQDGDGQAYEC